MRSESRKHTTKACLRALSTFKESLKPEVKRQNYSKISKGNYNIPVVHSKKTSIFTHSKNALGGPFTHCVDYMSFR